MIAHLKLNEVCDCTIGVTKKMYQDMLECAEKIEHENKHPFAPVKDCNSCSWDGIKFGDESFCTMQDVRKAILNNERNVTYYGEQ